MTGRMMSISSLVGSLSKPSVSAITSAAVEEGADDSERDLPPSRPVSPPPEFVDHREDPEQYHQDHDSYTQHAHPPSRSTRK